jgi:hypothetical protein
MSSKLVGFQLGRTRLAFSMLNQLRRMKKLENRRERRKRKGAKREA